MPQKLIRLTSSTGDGIFNGIFNEEIEIKQNSEIALQSLSVERISQSININGDNNQVDVASVGAFASADPTFHYLPNQFGEITPFGNFNKSNNQTFLRNVTAAINRSYDTFSAAPASSFRTWGMQHDVLPNSSNKMQVVMRVSPFYQIQTWNISPIIIDDMTFVEPDASVENNVLAAERVKVWEEFQTDEYGMYRETDTLTGGGGTEPNLNESYVFGSEAITKSTGAFRTRFKRLLGTGGVPSFTMGLVKGAAGLAKLQTSTFTLADLHYAIRANGPTTAMQYIAEAGQETWNNTVTPINHTTASWENQLNDVIDIRSGAGGVYGTITSQDAGGTVTATPLPAMVAYDATADYYWVIALHENKSKVVLDLVGVTLDPFGGDVQNLRTSSLNPFDQLTTTGFSLIGAGTASSLPKQEGLREDDFTPACQFNEDEVLSKYLGFGSDLLTNPVVEPSIQLFPRLKDGTTRPDFYLQTIGYQFTAINSFDNTYDSDTYLIDTQTFTLDSFDSFGLDSLQRKSNSGGGRRNIIATLPVTEVDIPGTANSLIQFQPATLNFIKIKNRGDVVTRQIRCRLLTGQYNPVKTEGLASLVLLIREGDSNE